jgi:hypothetical protein
MPTRTVLIVDRELGFVFWLGQALDRAGYQALPAKSCEDAAELLKQLNVEIHVLIVGHSLAGAAAFADSLRRSQGHLKVIDVIGDGEEPGPEFPGSDATQFMLSAVDEASETEWLETIEEIFCHDDATGRINHIPPKTSVTKCCMSYSPPVWRIRSRSK